MKPGGRRRRAGRFGLTLAALALLGLVPMLQSRPTAQIPGAPDDRYAGLQWRFVRVKYHYHTENTQTAQDFAGEPWFIDGPAAEQNLSRRVKTATAIQVEDPIVVPIEDPRLFEYPWVYFVEPGTLKLTEQDVTTLREYFLRGGTAMFDDFHGPLEWDNFEHEITRVFPDRPIIEVPRDHPVFSTVYKLDGFPQVAGIGSFMQGRTWEKGGFVPHLRTILDDGGRPMMFINWNSDLGDGWEWSNVVEFPQYIKYTSMSYQISINEIVYSLTH